MNTRTKELRELTTPEKIGAVCRGLRAMHGMSQAHLAQLMGITKPTVSAIESGENTASKYLTHICRAFGIKLGDIDLLMDLLVNSRRNRAQADG